jgi:hypothetical protein
MYHSLNGRSPVLILQASGPDTAGAPSHRLPLLTTPHGAQQHSYIYKTRNKYQTPEGTRQPVDSNFETCPSIIRTGAWYHEKNYVSFAKGLQWPCAPCHWLRWAYHTEGCSSRVGFGAAVEASAVIAECELGVIVCLGSSLTSENP